MTRRYYQTPRTIAPMDRTMNRRTFNHTLAGGIIGSALPLAAQEKDSRPNIVFLLTDDQRRDSLGCYGNHELQTPHIDRLASDGVLFENSFVTSAICTPSRACYFLGQFERHHGINFNSGTSLDPAAWENGYPMLLRKAGYFTGYIGKNHVPLGPNGYATGLMEKSFDFWYAAHGHLTFYPKNRSDIFKGAKAGTQPEVLQEGALSFIDPHQPFITGAEAFLRQRPASHPFCLSICFNLPHAAGTSTMKMLPEDPALYRTTYRDRMSSFALPANYTPKAQIHTPRLPANVLYAQYRQKSYDYVDTEASLRERLVRQYQTITGIDNVLGTIRARLAELGLDHNTVIVFASDHGIGGKALNYEPCLRIPMIVMDPRVPKGSSGQRRAELVQSIDIAPTLLNLASVAAPAAMQGRTLVPLTRGEKPKWREYAFAENLWSNAFGNPRIESVRSAEWKYIRYFATERALFKGTGEAAGNRVTEEQARAYASWLTASIRGLKPDHEELFHITNDPNETTNLAQNAKYNPILSRLHKQCDLLVREAKGNVEKPPLTIPLPPDSPPVPAE